MSVGMPAELYLEEFGSHVWAAFGTPPYLVGSALRRKRGWRDVDVRLMVTDEEWARLGFIEPESPYSFQHDAKWVAMTLAFSALGRSMTGLPIDFQIQPQTWANAKYSGERSALGFTPARMSRIQAIEEGLMKVTVRGE